MNFDKLPNEIMSSNEMSENGDCFSVAFNIVVYGGAANLILVHAVVEGKKVGKHVHAFVIDKSTNEVIDKSNGHDVKLPAAFYFDVGNISHVREYTVKQAIQHAIDTKHYGPWDEASKQN